MKSNIKYNNPALLSEKLACLPAIIQRFKQGLSYFK